MACSDSDYAYLRGLVMEQSANRIDPSRNALVRHKADADRAFVGCGQP